MKTGRPKDKPSSKVISRMNQTWNAVAIEKKMKLGNREKVPKIQPKTIPTIKFNRIFTKQPDNTFKLSGYKCSLCHKLFSDERLIKTHPLLCQEMISNR